MRRSLRVGRDGLTVAAVAFLAANLLHNLDHLRQGLDGLDIEVKAGGAIVTAAAVAVVLVALRHHPRAPLMATTVGFTAAALVAGSHLAPHWSVLSDSYIDDVHPDVLSWVVVLLEIATAFILGVVGLLRLRTHVMSQVGAQTDDTSELASAGRVSTID